MTDFSHRLQGIIPPPVTPLTLDGAFDQPSAIRLYGWMLEAGVHGLFLLGSSGEGPCLPEDVREQVIATAAGVVKGKIPLLAGSMAASTEQVVAEAKRAKELGADAIVACPPFYFRCNQEEIARHFRRIREAVDLPLVVYDIPATAKVKVATETMLELAREGTVCGVKDSSGDFVSFRRLLVRRPAGFRMLTGSELQVDSVLLAGADGSVPGLANVEARSFVALYEAWQAGRLEEVRELQTRMTRLFEVFARSDGTIEPGTAIGAMKTALWLRGVIATNQVTGPFRRFEEDAAARVRTILTELELL